MHPALYVFSLLIFFASSARFDGVAESDDGFDFIGKFVFDVSPEDVVSGTIDVELSVDNWTPELEESYKHIEVWLFDDEPDSWPAVYGEGVDCKVARTKAKNYKDGDIFGDYKVEFDANGRKVMKTANIYQHVRKRFWFLAVAHCPPEGTESHVLPPMNYKTHLLNTQRSGWDEEFGANKAGLQTLYLIFFFIFFPFTIVHFIGIKQLSQKLEYVHPMVKLFGLVVFLQLISIIAYLSYYGAFVQNGKGLPGALAVGEIMDVMARVVFILILMLMAKGWTISSDELTGKMFVLSTVGVFLVCDLLILLWKYAVDDPAATDIPVSLKIFVYVLLACWFALAFWFVYTIYNSYTSEDNPVKKGLFRNLALVYFPWFFGLPFVNLLTLFLAAWVRDRIVSCVSLVVSVIGYMVLSFLLWPSRAEEYFNISTPDVMSAQIDTYDKL